MQPSIVWAQRKDGRVLVTVRVHDCVDPVIKFTNTTLAFTGESDNKEHKFNVNLELYEEIIAEECKYLARARGIEVVLKKKDASVWWPRLAKTTKKLSYVTVDWDKWVDEDDDEDEKNDMDFGGMNFEDDDSDDDDDMQEAAPSEAPAAEAAAPAASEAPATTNTDVEID
ncbi:hypothetical protein TVAG_475160 [Trichomonas vaginalis G3]|uniref:CS domain-containing protein n=1 Tax=Trichomonas vaginalis (strain ATCC PRA-98 / G3) TaxID=412133 RepID=A2EM23_TRIV3|nr:prostaglandin-E synthase protein [Trichomonas vaginalis G3]EAY06282.1 hypothetical protein TVAG_475160 [Trichomonas vaginalis G3]KAI5503360.1 prostaglandin-E synthase protein [Trichomonas vaginalis G3]|eukprot:XP_001318505.1 hypothetical protein [Trichomonas vaginalis G3]